MALFIAFNRMYAFFTACVHMLYTLFVNNHIIPLLCFVCDTSQYFACGAIIFPSLFTWYCVNLPSAKTGILLHSGWWISVASLYTYDLMFLHLFSLITVTALFFGVKKYSANIHLLVTLTMILLVFLDRSALWALSLIKNPLKNFTITHFFAIILGTWILSSKVNPTGE